MKQSLHRTILAAAFAAATLGPAAAAAQPHPLAQHVLSRGVPDRKPPAIAPIARAQKADRLLYGRIDAVKSPLLLVRLRSGRELRVDASIAIRSGVYSQPLFAGKLVLLGGYYDAVKAFHARSITRITRLDRATPADS